jgi:hypothetical protein
MPKVVTRLREEWFCIEEPLIPLFIRKKSNDVVSGGHEPERFRHFPAWQIKILKRRRKK